MKYMVKYSNSCVTYQYAYTQSNMQSDQTGGGQSCVLTVCLNSAHNHEYLSKMISVQHTSHEYQKIFQNS